MPEFSKRSLIKLESCHQDLQTIFHLAIKNSPIDFGIAEGHRTLETQQKYYKQGLSKLDGIIKKSKHQASPSNAVDIYAYVNGQASWDEDQLIFIVGWIFKCADELNIKIRWGGNWDEDGEIISDQTFDDLVHIELKN